LELPPDFNDRAAAEGWDEKDRHEWDVLHASLEELGVSRLSFDGPTILVAHGDLPGLGIMRFRADASKPMLDALNKLVHELRPPLPGARST
jgi:hypothetical protein